MFIMPFIYLCHAIAQAVTFFLMYSYYKDLLRSVYYSCFYYVKETQSEERCVSVRLAQLTCATSPSAPPIKSCTRLLE